MASVSRARAVARLSVFAIGSWLVVARALSAVVSRFPLRFPRTCPHNARWARLGQRCLGISVRSVGEPPAPGSLVVSNHLGYADIVTIGGLVPCIYAARHDMRRWPLFGALAASGATIFINREAKRASARGVARVAVALAAGATVLGFPEGTSAGGADLLPFRSGLFQAAVDVRAPVVPAAVRYMELDGEPITADNLDVVGWFRGEGFFTHVLRLASHRSVTAEVRFGAAIRPPHADRRTLAAAAEEQVRELCGLPARSRAAARGDEVSRGVARP
jgi:1-acyl-sn-glycerol-3-phosphate acyltransferase